ncbi:MAG: YHS domain-containing (seleno)protein [Phycisphaerales bacterium]
MNHKALIASMTLTMLAPTSMVAAHSSTAFLAQSANNTSQPETTAAPIRNIKEWDLSKKSLAIDGYDPVAYFPEGGSKPTKGKKSITLTYKGVNYRFASAANREAFEKNPSKYEPAFGGWCAWAMSKGTKTEINPKTYIIKDDRLYLFYNGLFGNTKDDWEKGNHASLSDQADAEWKTISGESPRLPTNP